MVRDIAHEQCLRYRLQNRRKQAKQTFLNLGNVASWSREIFRESNSRWSRNFPDEWLRQQKIMACNPIEDRRLDGGDFNSVRLGVVSWNLPDSSGETSQAVKMSEGIEG